MTRLSALRTYDIDDAEPRLSWSQRVGAIRSGEHNHQLIAYGLIALCAAVSLAVVLDPARTRAGPSSDETLRLLRRTGGDLSDNGMKVLAGLSPSAALIATRLAPLPPPPEFSAPGDPSAADLPTPPTLTLPGGITAEQAKLINDAIPVSHLGNPAAKPFFMPPTDLLDATRAVDCMTAAVYYEAGSEPLEGQRAVAQVVLNRMRHPAFPKSVCAVVFQGANRSTGCQFTFTCDGSLYRKPSAAIWQRAREVAVAALNGYVEKTVGNATHYHADYVAPYWSTSLIKVAKIGAHIFYRWTGGWGEPRSFAAIYAGGEQSLMPGAGTLQPDLSVTLGAVPGAAAPALTLRAANPADAGPGSPGTAPATAQSSQTGDASAPAADQAGSGADPRLNASAPPPPQPKPEPARGHWSRLPIPH